MVIGLFVNYEIVSLRPIKFDVTTRV